MQQKKNHLNTQSFLYTCFISTLGISVFGLGLLLTSLNLSAAEPLRIATEQLNTTLKTPGLVILDARPETAYQESHIQGALNFPETWTYHDKSIDGRIVQPTQVQTILRALGIKIDSPVVIYDGGQMIAAARLFWTLEVYGLKNIKILNKGYAQWLELDLPISFETPYTKASNYIPVINHERLATKLTTLLATKNPNQHIIDARPNPSYLGLKSTAKRFGHIPKAINIPASHNLSQTNQINSLKSIEALKALYADIPKTKKVVLYCAVGRISALNYFTLRELGYNVANYDASWKEWANDFGLDIVKELGDTRADKINLQPSQSTLH